MLTRWIVDVYAWIIEIALWFFLVSSAAAGFYWTGPILSDAGWIIENEGLWALAGAVFSASAAFLMSAVVVGPVVVLVDIRNSVRSLEKRGIGYASSAKEVPTRARNPFLEHDADRRE